MFLHDDGMGNVITTDVSKVAPNSPTMTIKIGRPGRIHSITEYLHPQLAGYNCWAIPTLARFSTDQFASMTELKQVEWLTMYQTMMRLRKSILHSENRVKNAYELGRISERHQSRVPNLDYFVESNGYTPQHQIGAVAAPAVQEWTRELKECYPGVFNSIWKHEAE